MLLASVWVVLLIAFWIWWLDSDHVLSASGIVINSALLLYVSLLPLLFVCAVLRLRRVDPLLKIEPLRVGFLVTKAPSEPWTLVRTTLQAMLAQDFPYPYQTWLCDEDPDDDTRRWCAEHGVRISTRKNVDAYHHVDWPRRTKCKEGNLAYFYDTYGYNDFDVIAQLDADHVPSPNYLREVIRPFTDPAIGYVAAPSVCDSNANDSWAARGRLYKEATLHGPMQAGANDGWAPLCIGSHYAVRTSALKTIRGIGPELAEDFTTTFLLNAAGWHGAFAIDAHASGEGPPTFPAAMVQEFQWSRSLATVLVDLVPKHMKRLPWRLRLRFGFALAFYPLLFATTTAGVLLPPVAALRGVPWVHVNYLGFLARWCALSIPLILLSALLRRRSLLRPIDSRLISWEMWIFGLARWPYVAWGVLAGATSRLQKKTVTFRVTPKDSGLAPLPGRLMLPYFAITTLGSIAAVLGRANEATRGYVFLSLLSATAYAVVGIGCPVLHARESRRSTGAVWSDLWPQVRAAAIVSTLQVAMVTTAISVVGLTWTDRL